MLNNNQNNFDELFILSVMANILQVGNYVMSVRDLKNTDIAQELNKQNDIYLKKIIEQNEEIIEQNTEIIQLLKEG